MAMTDLVGPNRRVRPIYPMVIDSTDWEYISVQKTFSTFSSWKDF